MVTSPNASPKIAIVGGGPGGLCLANILIKNSIPCHVYEQEASSSARSQGGCLDLHPLTGQAALRSAGLYDEFEKHARYEGEDFILADKTGRRYIDRRGEASGGKPEIDRVLLRQILLDALPKGVVKWGQSLRRAGVRDGKGTLYFRDHTEEGFDLIVGADGAWSKIRHLCTSFKPFYSSVSMFDIWIPDIDARYPHLGQLIGRGSYFAFGEQEQQCMLVQRNGDGSARIYAGGKKHEEWVGDNGLDKKTPELLRESMLRDYSTWNDELKELIRAADDNINARPLYMLPVGARWMPVLGITLIGDAAHLMTPFGGEGVNMALQDAMVLAQAIVDNISNLAQGTAEYEKRMFVYAEQATAKTWKNLQDRFEPGGIQKFVDLKNMMTERMRLQEKDNAERQSNCA